MVKGTKCTFLCGLLKNGFFSRKTKYCFILFQDKILLSVKLREIYPIENNAFDYLIIKYSIRGLGILGYGFLRV